MAGLPMITWMRFFVWLIIGLVIYFFYSRKRSEFVRRAPDRHERRTTSRLSAQPAPCRGDDAVGRQSRLLGGR